MELFFGLVDGRWMGKKNTDYELYKNNRFFGYKIPTKHIHTLKVDEQGKGAVFFFSHPPHFRMFGGW